MTLFPPYVQPHLTPILRLVFGYVSALVFTVATLITICGMMLGFANNRFLEGQLTVEVLLRRRIMLLCGVFAVLRMVLLLLATGLTLGVLYYWGLIAHKYIFMAVIWIMTYCMNELIHDLLCNALHDPVMIAVSDEAPITPTE